MVVSIIDVSADIAAHDTANSLVRAGIMRMRFVAHCNVRPSRWLWFPERDRWRALIVVDKVWILADVCLGPYTGYSCPARGEASFATFFLLKEELMNETVAKESIGIFHSEPKSFSWPSVRKMKQRQGQFQSQVGIEKSILDLYQKWKGGRLTSFSETK